MSFDKIIYILNISVIFLFTSLVYSQTDLINSLIIKSCDIDFKIDYVKTNNSLFDTVKIKYSVVNNSDSNVFIFNPDSYYGKSNTFMIDTNKCFKVVDLGGYWVHNFGYENYFILRRIKPNSYFEYIFSFKIVNVDNLKKCKNLFIDIIKELNFHNSLYFFFYIGFIKEDDLSDIEIIHKIDDNVFEFEIKDYNYDIKKFPFEHFIKKILLGPMLIL